MRTTGASIVVVVGLLALPSYAAAQALPTDPPSGYFDDQGNPAGNVDNITYGSDYPARVYTPPGYSESQTYASMYLMHGLGGSERSWHDNDLYAHIQLDNLIAEGVVDPFIIVFTRNDLDNWNFGDILINELIPYIEENYSVSTDPDHRALGGLSMGGMQTINIGFPNADKFRYLMPSSSAPGIQGENQLFPDDGELARNNLNLLFFSWGENEIGEYGEENNTMVMGYCENAGISADIIYDYSAPGGGHDRNTWRPSFWNFAQLADQAGFTDVEGGMGGSGGMGAGGGGGMGTGNAGAGGANGGNSMTGGSGGDAGEEGGAGNGAGGTASSTGGTDAQGGTAGMPGSGMTGGAPATGGATPATGGTVGTGGTAPTTGGTAAATGGIAATTGGQLSTAGSTNPGGAELTSADDGCACSLPGSKSKTSALALFAAAAAVVLYGARRGRRRSLRA